MSTDRKPQTRAVIYARISSDRDEKGEGIERQIEACRERAEREGWTLVGDPLRDDSISAWRSGVVRPAYQELLRMVRDGDVDVVLVWHLSRLWRSRVERASGIDVFKDARVRLVVVKGSEIDFSTAMGRGMVAMLGEVDTMESDIKSERILEQKKQAAEQGRFRGGRRPFGFEADGVTVREPEAAVVREATRAVLGGRAMNAVAQELNGRGVRTTTGGSWNTMKLKRVLLRARNAGLIATGNSEAYNVEIIGKASWPALVEEEEYHALVKMLTDATHRRSAGWSKLKWFGSGLYYCGRCGARMRSSSVHTKKRKMSVYRCSAYSHVTVMATKTDDHVRAKVTELLGLEQIVRALSAETDSDTAQADRERRTLLRTRLRQTEADYDDDVIDGRRYKAKTAKLRVELEEIESRLADAAERSSALPIVDEDAPAEAFAAAAPDVQRAVTNALLHVVVLPNTQRGAAWSDRRVLTFLAQDVEDAGARLVIDPQVRDNKLVGASLG